MRIAGRRVGADAPVFIIAEACDNHMGSLDAAKEMCLQAKLAGCDCIKFSTIFPRGDAAQCAHVVKLRHSSL